MNQPVFPRLRAENDSSVRKPGQTRPNGGNFGEGILPVRPLSRQQETGNYRFGYRCRGWMFENRSRNYRRESHARSVEMDYRTQKQRKALGALRC